MNVLVSWNCCLGVDVEIGKPRPHYSVTDVDVFWPSDDADPHLDLLAVSLLSCLSTLSRRTSSSRRLAYLRLSGYRQ